MKCVIRFLVVTLFVMSLTLIYNPSFAFADSLQSVSLTQVYQVGTKEPESFQPNQENASEITKNGLYQEKVFHSPGASYIAVHFTKFNLAEGDYVTVSDPQGNHLSRYEGKGKVVRGGEAVLPEFWATHLPGDTALVRYYNYSGLFEGYGFLIDEWAHGFPKENFNELFHQEDQGDLEAICGENNKEWAPCYKGDEMYEKARAVARLLINGNYACTGWLIGSQGNLMTNNHCIKSQSDADNTDYQFMAEGATCSTSCNSWFACPGKVEATSGKLIKTDYNLDYSLIKLPDNLTSSYGYLQLRNAMPNIGERIYIPQHPQGWGKQLAVKVDDGSFASIYSTSQPPCKGGPGDIGYYADTARGSSGSPVIAYQDHLVVALHHCANCPNRGVPINAIISDLGDDLPPNALATSNEAMVTDYQPFVSRNYALDAERGTVYYVVPEQTDAFGPQTAIWSGQPGYSEIKVSLKDLLTHDIAEVILRGQRSSGCNALKKMNDGIMCYDYQQGPLTLTYHEEDNETLPAGMYTGSFYVLARGWHDHSVNQYLKIDVEIKKQ
ncbi:MAG: trypsin-like peptidase domain-containing protein [Hormoscilla sp. GUM202]|nr:trypsin-like peptidase domain-containing protein [Hormoscilla sp. GUM202]